MLPYWHDVIVPSLAAGLTVLVVAHGNSLRALVKHLDGISDEAIAELNIPTGIPLCYELDDSYAPVVPGGRYLDPGSGEGSRRGIREEPGPLGKRAGWRMDHVCGVSGELRKGEHREKE